MVHLLLVLVLFLMAFRPPHPLPGEEGVEVNLGLYDQGTGDTQSDQPSAPKPSPQPSQNKKSDTQKDDKVVTQDTDDAPSINNGKKEEPKKDSEGPKDQPQKTDEDPQPTVNEKALFKRTDKPQNGESEGKTDQTGNQGNPNGLIDNTRYDNLGGKGVKADLGGRGEKHLERKKLDEIAEEGVVVVDIWVNPEGKVIRAKAGAQGTDVTNSQMWRTAESFALASTFNEDKNAPSEQHGTITYTFKWDYNK